MCNLLWLGKQTQRRQILFKHLFYVFGYLVYLKAEGQRDFPCIGPLFKCLKQPGLSHAKVRNPELKSVFHVGGRDPSS